jgi:hypothetical protein
MYAFAMLKRTWFRASACTSLLACSIPAGFAQTTPRFELIKPSETNPAIAHFDDANMIVRPEKLKGAPIMVWFAGTGGKPESTKALMNAVAGQGYRAVGLAYNDDPAIGQVCPRSPDPACAAKFREMRISGTGDGLPEARNPVDEGIVTRLVSLLKTLDKRHPDEGWKDFLTADGQPKWSRIGLSGLSQGAGMAAFLAKKHEVLRVVLFSSPVDSMKGPEDIQLPAWLRWPSATPPDRWYAERNSREPFNPGLMQSYPALGIPLDHIRVFSLDLPPGANAANPMSYHGINVKDTRYLPQWKFLFGEAKTE